MKKQTITAVLAAVLVITGCGNSTSNSTEDVSGETLAAVQEESGHATVSSVTLTEGKYSEEKLDDTWDENVPVITMNQTEVDTDAKGVSVNGTDITITKAGTYVLTGELTDGQIQVSVPNKGQVQLVLDNASVTCSDSAPIYIEEGDTVITLAGGSENYLEDGAEYTYDQAGEDEPKAVVFAKDDLTFNGSGTLLVQGNYKNGIQSKDALKIVDGTYQITSVDNGIVGKDSVSFRGGTLTVSAGGDGVKATNAEETDKGYVMIDGGTITIDAQSDGIQAETLLRINDGILDITSGSGSENALQNQNVPAGEIPQGDRMPGDREAGNAFRQEEQQAEETGGKGLKSYVDIILAGGKIVVDAYDDAVHSNSTITVEDGTCTVNAGDDGFHADQSLTINGGVTEVNKSYEGLEAFEIVLNGGDTTVYASDDGINAAGDSGQDETGDSAASPETGMGRGGPDMAEDQGASLTINGGTLYVNASGDALDANGDIIMTGGKTELQGPTSGGDGTLDYAGECNISGGTFLAVGSSGMAQNPGDASEQTVICGNFDSQVEAGTTITVSDADGKEILSVAAEKTSQWYCFSSPELETGQTYTMSAGGMAQEITL